MLQCGKVVQRVGVVNGQNTMQFRVIARSVGYDTRVIQLSFIADFGNFFEYFLSGSPEIY